MHVRSIRIAPERFPTRAHYPFNLRVFGETKEIALNTPVTLFIGENGTGKSTLLKALVMKCAITIWKEADRLKVHHNPYSDLLYQYLEVEWINGSVPGSYFSSEIFRTFAEALDEWATADPEMLKYFGGESLVTKSHGQCHMAYFKSRYVRKGLYLLDEPENALSPRKQLELLKTLQEMSQAGHAQFLVATHSPILLALPGADIYSFDYVPLRRVAYEDTDYYQIYKDFLNNRSSYLDG